MSSQEKNKQGKIVGIIVGAIVFGLVSYGVKSFFKKDIIDEFKDAVTEMNAEMPRKVDEYTRLDSVALIGKSKFMYYYTMKDLNTVAVSTDTVKKYMKLEIVKTLRVSPDMKPFRENNFTLSHNYFDEQGELLFDIIATPTDYK